jgi:hypothetical protein
MASILDALTQQLGGDAVDQISNQIGADRSSVSDAISIALPVILGGLANNASNPQGAQSLDQALAQDHDGSILDLLPVILGGGAPQANPRSLDGGGILDHILGGRREPVEDGISRQTGLGKGQVAQLLMMLAPIVMAYLGRQKQQQNMGPGDLGDALERERGRIDDRAPGMGDMLGQLFDQNGDGSVVDDIARMAPSVLGGLFGNRR